MAIVIKDINHVQRKSEVPKRKFDFLSLLNKEISLNRGNLSDRKKESFYSEMNILLSSGVDIRSALDIVVEEQKKESEKKLFEEIRDRVINGKSISESILETGKFSAYEYHSLRIGEESGRLKDVLSGLNSYFSKKIKQRRQVVSALTYPALVLITAVIAVFFMMNFIVPMFVDVFKRFNGQIPALTQAIIRISSFFKSYSLLLLLFLLGIAVVIMLIRKKTFFRAWYSKLLIRLPLFGGIIQKVYLVRFCETMALLIGARTPMVRSIQLVKQMIGFYPYEVALEKISSDILHGKLLHQSLQQFDLFSSRVVSLVKVAEEVNQLDVIFSKLSIQLNEELEHKIGLLSSLLEPVMIMFVGVLVAVILISMYLPLFQLGTSIY
ncbi:MAG TPA: type II secretion system F family protein [Bacteroidales bacterium]|nr:type II secretion system F family protein [Bacteroidales bacterium]